MDILAFIRMDNPWPRIAPRLRSYQVFDPAFEWVREEGVDTLLLYISGFKKEQIKVQLDNRGNIRVTGERPLEGNRWTKFRKEFRLPEKCIVDEIKAKFENGLLYVTLPKISTIFESAQTEAKRTDGSDEQHGHKKEEGESTENQDHHQKINPGSITATQVAEPSEASGGAKESPTEEKSSGLKTMNGAGSMRMKLNKRKKLMTIVIVTLCVFVGVGMYVGYKKLRT